MRIDNSGNVIIGTTTAASNSELTLRAASPHLSLYATPGNDSRLNMGDTDNHDIGMIAYANSDNSMRFTTNASERIRIDSSGDLGLGVSPDNVGSMRTLHIKGPSNEGAAIRLQADGDTPGSSDAQIYKNSSALYLRVDGTDPLITYLNGAERMRVQSSGRVLIAKSSSNFANAGIELRENGEIVATRSGGDVITTRRLVSEGTHFSLRNISGTSVGAIVTTSSGTAYNSSSDYRLKENVVDIVDGITRVKQLQPRRFNFIVDDTTTVDGFLAHEAQTVVPEAVTGEKDGEEMQGIDQSKLVPLLTAALKEAITKIETLEAKVAALEAG